MKLPLLLLALAACSTTKFRHNSEHADAWMCGRVPGGNVECIDLREYQRGACACGTNVPATPKPLEI